MHRFSEAGGYMNIRYGFFALLLIVGWSGTSALAGPFSISDQGVVANVHQDGPVATVILSYLPDELKASAVSFTLAYPSSLFQANTSDCLAELPAGFSGGCRATDGEVRVIVYSPTNEALPPGAFGSVTLSGLVTDRELRADRSRAQAARGSSSIQQSSLKLGNVELGVPASAQ